MVRLCKPSVWWRWMLEVSEIIIAISLCCTRDSDMAQHSWGYLSECLPGEQLPGSSCAAGGLEISLLWVGNSYWCMCWYIARISCRNFGTTWFWFWFYLSKWTFPTCVTVAPLAVSFLSNILTNSLLVACVDICNGVFLFLFFPVRKKSLKKHTK